MTAPAPCRVSFFVPGRAANASCIVDECEAKRKARGYCNRHYLQVVFYGKEPTPPQRYDTTVRDQEGRKLCVTCMTWRDEGDFHNSKKCKDGYASTCIDCYRRRYNHKVRHGLDDTQVASIMERQGGLCICGSDGPFVIDHDHSCCPGRHGCVECVRGFLCQPCNKTLAFSRDSSEVLRRLADYVDGGGS